MKVKLFVMLMALLLMAIVTSAQSYSIRVTFNTNLRSAGSLQANIIETALSGTTTERGQRIESLASNQSKRERSLDGELGQPYPR